MARPKKHQINTHFDRLTVKVDPTRRDLGSGVFDLGCLDIDTAYPVLATFLRRWDDGSSTPVFLIEGPGGAIVEKACDRFLVAEVS